jgi:5-methylcytosine-specific restriction endonuclease McrA
MSTSVLTNKVLVLNKHWMPINVTTVFKAVCKTFEGHALFVDPETYATYDFESWIFDWDEAVDYAHLQENILRCARYGLQMPEIIVCTNYDGTGFSSANRRPKFSRRNVFARDRDTCQYCGKKCRKEDLNLEHIVPKSRGGGMTWKNIVLSCIPCNDRKRDRTPAEAGMHLIREPFIPKAEDIRRPYTERLRRKIGQDVPKNWEQFLGKMYWDSELS